MTTYSDIEKQLQEKVIRFVHYLNIPQLKLLDKIIQENIAEFNKLEIEHRDSAARGEVSVEGALAYKRDIGQY